MIQLLTKIDKLFYKISYWFIVALVSIVFVLLFGGVIGRYIFSYTPFFLEELSRYILIWIGALGANIAIRNGEFMVVDVFLEKIPHHVRKIIMKFVHLIIFIFLIFLLVVSFNHSVNLNNNSSATLPVSMLWPTLAIPIGVLFMIPYYVLSILNGKDKEEQK